MINGTATETRTRTLTLVTEDAGDNVETGRAAHEVKGPSVGELKEKSLP